MLPHFLIKFQTKFEELKFLKYTDQPYRQMPPNFEHISVSGHICRFNKVEDERVKNFSNCVYVMFKRGVKRLISLAVNENDKGENQLWNLSKSLHPLFKNDYAVKFIHIPIKDWRNFKLEQALEFLNLYHEKETSL
jgi:hypothetical protein